MRRTLIVLAMLLVANALPTPARADDNLHGLNRVDPALVRGIVAEVDADSGRDRVAQAIRELTSMGYFSQVEVRRADGSLHWYFQERPFVVEVAHEGITELSTETIEKTIRIRTREFLDPNAIRETREAFATEYADEGFADTEVIVRTEPVSDEGDVRVVIEAREVSQVRVMEVRIRGTRDLTEADLQARMESRPPNGLSWMTSQGQYERGKAERDRFRIEGAYLEQGYLKVQVEGPDVTYLPGGRAAIIEYDVKEGPQYTLGEMTFGGDVFFRPSTLSDIIGLETGKPLNRIKLDEGIRAIVDAYSDFGFAFARVVPDFAFDESERIAHVRLDISRGPMVYVRAISIVGNTKTRDKVIRRELQIHEGELFNGSAIKLSRERIFALGFFETVTFETNAVGEDQLDLAVRVTERPTGTASAGLGFSSIDKFVGNLRLNFGNLAGYGVRLDLQLEFGGRRRSFSISYSDPYFLDSPFSLGIDAFRTRQEFASRANVQAFTQSNLGASISVGYKLALFTRAIVTLRDEIIDFSNVSVRSPRFFTDGETRSLSFALRRDSRDHPYDPKNGTLSVGSVEYAGYFLGGDHTFTKYRMVMHQLVTVWEHLTLSFRGEGGLATTRGDRVPFAERYFLGGIFSVRGYDFRSVGPSLLVSRDPSDPYAGVTRVFVGGNKQLFFNSELIFPLIPPAGIKGVVFFDVGNTWLEEEAFFARAMRMGYGLGFRWFSPIGPLRFEWGFPIKKQPEERSRVFEFSIGSFF